MLEIAESLIDARTAYDIFITDELPNKPYFESSIKVAMSICTIGYSLPNKSREYLKMGKLSDGVILDAIGSVAADQLADIVNDRIDTEAKKMGMTPSMRYSPGYCDMLVDDQNIIFDRVDNVGVVLSESKMMNPIKSISFCVNLGYEFINRCITCDRKKNCPHRR